MSKLQKWVAASVLVSLLLGAFFASPPPAYADIHLTVVVTDCETKQPISNATVTVVTADGRPTKPTNPRGQATFSKVRPGDMVHTVSVSHPQYQPASASQHMRAWSSAGMTICLKKGASPPQQPPTPPSSLKGTQCIDFLLKIIGDQIGLSEVQQFLVSPEKIRQECQATPGPNENCFTEKSLWTIAKALGKFALKHFFPAAKIAHLAYTILMGWGDLQACLDYADFAFEFMRYLAISGGRLDYVGIHSPARALVADSQGRRTGVLSDGKIVNEIPDSHAGYNGEHLIIILPSGNLESVELEGTGAGKLGLDLVRTVGDRPGAYVESMRFENVEVSPSSQGRLDLSLDEPRLLMDSDGASGPAHAASLDPDQHDVTPVDQDAFEYWPAPLPLPAVTPTLASVPPEAVANAVFSISGMVLDKNNIGVGGVRLVDQHGHTTHTDSQGAYTLGGLAPGEYLLSVSGTGRSLWPEQLVATIDGANLSDQDFVEIWCGSETPTLFLQGSADAKEGLAAPAWGQDMLAAGRAATIGANGGRLTAYAMLLDTLGNFSPGFQTTPAEFNAWLLGRDGLRVDNGLLPAAALSFVQAHGVNAALSFAAFESCEQTGVQTVAASSRLARHVCSGGMAVIGVDGGRRWALAHGVAGWGMQATIVISDPRKGQTTLAQEGYQNQYCGAEYLNVQPGASAQPANPAALGVILPDQVEALLVGPQGLKTGFDPRNGQRYAEIPRSTYGRMGAVDGEGAGEPRSLLALQPQTGRYQILAFSADGTPFQLIVTQVGSQGDTIINSYMGAVAPGTVQTFAIDYRADGAAASSSSLPLDRLLMFAIVVVLGLLLLGFGVLIGLMIRHKPNRVHHQ